MIFMIMYLSQILMQPSTIVSLSYNPNFNGYKKLNYLKNSTKQIKNSASSHVYSLVWSLKELCQLLIY